MFLCPTCGTELRRTTYESVPLFACERCRGHLICEARLDSIREERRYDEAELRRQAVHESSAERQNPLQCPACCSQMDRQHVLDVIEIDVCLACDRVWLDAGEIALLQLAHEASTGAQSEREARARFARLVPDPNRRARLEENVSRSEPSGVLDAVGEVSSTVVSLALEFLFAHW